MRLFGWPRQTHTQSQLILPPQASRSMVAKDLSGLMQKKIPRSILWLLSLWYKYVGKKSLNQSVRVEN